jgi:hypothetical protein
MSRGLIAGADAAGDADGDTVLTLFVSDGWLTSCFLFFRSH